MATPIQKATKSIRGAFGAPDRKKKKKKGQSVWEYIKKEIIGKSFNEKFQESEMVKRKKSELEKKKNK